jgi:hypothetical protein
MKRRLFLGLLPALLLVPPAGICSPADPNFSGTWKQRNERSVPTRTGNVIVQIDHHDPDMTMETTILHGSAAPRHSVQRYTTDGKTSTSTGADGDEFHTSVVWSGPTLVFSVEEHEDGRIILSRETWSLIENGAALERRRERKETAGEQTIIYLRDTPKP